MKILENLWQVGGGDLSAPGDAAVYLLQFDRQAVLIDAGCGPGHWQIVDNIALVLPPGVRIVYLLLTHCHFDHTGGAAALRDQYGCPIAAHAQDAVFLEAGDSKATAANWYGAEMAPFTVDEKIDAPTTTLTVGHGTITAHHCPGHTPGSLVFTSRMSGRTVLFGQDVHGPLHPSFFSDGDQYRQSLEYMLTLEADILCEGHFGVIEGRAQVYEFIRYYLD